MCLLSIYTLSLSLLDAGNYAAILAYKGKKTNLSFSLFFKTKLSDNSVAVKLYLLYSV